METWQCVEDILSSKIVSVSHLAPTKTYCSFWQTTYLNRYRYRQVHSCSSCHVLEQTVLRPGVKLDTMFNTVWKVFLFHKSVQMKEYSLNVSKTCE